MDEYNHSFEIGNIMETLTEQFQHKIIFIGHTKSFEECFKVGAMNKFEIQETKAYSKLLNY